MSMPDSTFAIVALVVLVVPGLVYAVVRTSLRGFRADDKGIDTRIAQAILVSVVLDAVYLVVGYSHLGVFVKVTDKSIDIVDPVGLGITILVGAVIVPGLIAGVVYSPWRLRRKMTKARRLRLNRLEEKRLRRQATEANGLPFKIDRRTRYSSVPTAWDEAAVLAEPRFVRILLPDGRYVGGWWGPRSYVSTYPEPRDMFISFPYEMQENGKFGHQKMDSDGIWFTVPDGAIVEWVRGPEIPQRENNEGIQDV